MVKVLPDTYTMLLMSLLSSVDKLTVLLVLPEWCVLLRRGAGLGLAFGLAAGLGFVTAGFGLWRVMVLCAAMPMGQSMRSRVRMMCFGFMMCVSLIICQ